jgi:5-methylcytosine-specific restriction endonuclease McrA
MGKLKAIGGHLTPLAPTLGYLPQVERGSAAERSIFAPWRKWYGTARWRALRMVVFVRDGFTCQWPGCGRIEANTSKLVADHRTPHRGDEALFWDEDNLQTLCKPCHDKHKQRAERSGRD